MESTSETEPEKNSLTARARKSAQQALLFTKSQVSSTASWSRKDPLRAATLIAVLGALGIAAVIWLLIGFPLVGDWTWTIGAGEMTGADAVRIVLTMIAGIGGIVALVIAYRKQRGAEEGRFMASLENAARQMGAIEPTVQFAGIYAIASLADESNDVRKQKCVDVLCGYLRLPYTTTYEPSTLREVSETRTRSDARGRFEETRTHQHRPAEKEVRLTIIRTITERLGKDVPNSWSTLNLDFRNAVFDDGDFAGAHFNGKTTFAGVHFAGGTVDFSGARFEGGTVDFGGAQFEGGSVHFGGARFAGGTVSFNRAQFAGGTVHFGGAQFEGGTVSFTLARFAGGTVSFNRAQFEGGTVHFGGAQFEGGTVSFLGARFAGGTVHFGGARFAGGTVRFTLARFEGGTVRFTAAQFKSGTVSFKIARFEGGIVDFTGPFSWTKPPLFSWSDGSPPAGVRPSIWPPELVPRPEPDF